MPFFANRLAVARATVNAPIVRRLALRPFHSKGCQTELAPRNSTATEDRMQGISSANGAGAKPPLLIIRIELAGAVPSPRGAVHELAPDTADCLECRLSLPERAFVRAAKDDNVTVTDLCAAAAPSLTSIPIGAPTTPILVSPASSPGTATCRTQGAISPRRAPLSTPSARPPTTPGWRPALPCGSRKTTTPAASTSACSWPWKIIRPAPNAGTRITRPC